MKKLACLLILVMLCVCAAPMSAAFAAGNDLDLGDPDFSTATKYTFSELEVNSTDSINTVTISVDSGSITTPSISGATVYKDEGNSIVVINYSASQDAATVQAMLRGIGFTADPDEQQHVSVKLQDLENENIPADATIKVLKLDGKPHFYLLVKGNIFTPWDTAYNRAKEMVLMGNQGYLATITCAEETDVLEKYPRYHAWVGSVRNAAVGDADKLTTMPAMTTGQYDFYWNCGPEADTLVRSGYTNWYPGEPNNAYGNEYIMFAECTNGKWYDIGVGNSQWVKGCYYVEFGGYPDSNPHSTANKNVAGADETDVTCPGNEAAELINKAAEEAKKKIDALDELTDYAKDYYRQAIDEEAQRQKKKIDDAVNEDDLKKVVNDAKESINAIVDEPVAIDFLLKYNTDPTTQDLISETDQITPANAPGIVAGKRAWDKLTPNQKKIVNKFLETSTWPELYRYAHDLITPKTGDNTNMPLIALLMLLSTIGLAAATAAKRRFN